MSFLMFYCLKVLISAIFEKRVTDRRTDGRTDGRTDRRTDGRTDKASYRDAWTHLKRIFNKIQKTQYTLQWSHGSNFSFPTTSYTLRVCHWSHPCRPLTIDCSSCRCWLEGLHYRTGMHLPWLSISCKVGGS